MIQRYRHFADLTSATENILQRRYNLLAELDKAVYEAVRQALPSETEAQTEKPYYGNIKYSCLDIIYGGFNAVTDSIAKPPSENSNG